MAELVLALDQGTTGSAAAIFDVRTLELIKRRAERIASPGKFVVSLKTQTNALALDPASDRGEGGALFSNEIDRGGCLMDLSGARLRW